MKMGESGESVGQAEVASASLLQLQYSSVGHKRTKGADIFAPGFTLRFGHLRHLQSESPSRRWTNSMPKTAKIHRKRRSPHDPEASLSRDEVEERIQKAIESWKRDESPNLLSAAKKHGIAHKYSTLRRRAHGLTQTYSNSRKKQRLFTDAQ